MSQEYAGKSRSQKKRESHALQRLGERLVALPVSTLAGFDLSSALFAALRDCRSMKTHEAKRRQMQYIGRMMREEADEATIRARLDTLLAPARAETDEICRLEKLREKLLVADETALAALFAHLAASYPDLEIPRLRHIITQAKAERAKAKPPKAYRALFRYLKTFTFQV